MPAGAKILPLRSNIPAISEFAFAGIDPDFATRAKAAGSGIVIGGHNYGQGSSREHAALAPMYLGVKIVLAKSFARIHYANLVNFGILPLTFCDEADYDELQQDDVLSLTALPAQLQVGRTIEISNETSGRSFTVQHDLTERQLQIILAGGLLNFTRSQA